MYRVVLSALLLLLVPALVAAQEKKDADKPSADKKAADSAADVSVSEQVLVTSGGRQWQHDNPLPVWQKFVLVFAIALLVIIVVQLMMLRSELAEFLEKVGSSSGSMKR